MDPALRDRILRALEPLDDDKGYQVLDYVAFLESRYARRPAAPDTVFSRFAGAVEDTLRASRVSAGTVAQAMGLMNQAMGVLAGVTAAGKSVVEDVAAVGKQVASDLTATARGASSAPASAPPGGTAFPPDPGAPGASASAAQPPADPPMTSSGPTG